VKRRWLLFAALIGVAAVLLWVAVRWIANGQGGGTDADQRATVRVGSPRLGSIERALSTSGTLIAGSTVYVTSKVSGRIEAIDVREGQKVAQGDLLVQIDDRSPRLQLDQAHAAWQAAQAQYEKAMRGARPEELENARALYGKARMDLTTAEESFARSQQLYQSGTIPKAQFEQAESTLRAARTELENAGRSLQMLEEGASQEEKRAARAQAEAARAGYELARLQLDNTRIRAPGPAEAVVAKVLQDEGNIVGTSTALLVLVQDQWIQIEIELAEKYYGEVLGSGESLEARIFPQAYPGMDAFQARLSSVAPTIDPRSRTFTVALDIQDPLDLLRPGMYAEVELILKRIPDALLVPESSVLERDGEQFVFVAEGNGDNAVASARPVVIGLSNAAEVQILSGIDPQERIIVEGNAFLEEGQSIGILEQK
jgi:RND family efflux transporter MFP subunit